MSIFRINNSKVPKNTVKLKYQEDIVSSSLDSIKNEPQHISHFSAKFNNFVGSVIGTITDKTYYPIFSIGSPPDSGNLYRLTSFVYRYIQDFFNNASTDSLDPPPALNFALITSHLLSCKNQDNQDVYSAIRDTTHDQAVDIFFETIFDTDTDPEFAEILAYKTWNNPEPL